MTMEYRLPDLGEDTTEGEVVKVLVSEGDIVEEDQTVIELETDKALLEVPSPVAGRVTRVHVVEGATLKVNDMIITIEEAAGAKPAAGVSGESSGAKATEKASTESASSPPPDPIAIEPSGPKAEIKMVRAAAGASQQSAKVVEVGNRAVDPPRPPASPSVRKLARELGVDLAKIRSAAPTGRLSKDDVMAHVRARVSEQRVGSAPGGAPSPPTLPDFSRWGPIERRPLSNVRKRTMESLSRSWGLIPHVTQVDEADITELLSLRERHAARAAAKGGKLTVTVFVLKAVISALKKYPQFNASLDPEAGELILKNYYHMGIAVDTEHGLMVPVIRDADQKSLVDLSAELITISERARTRKVKLGDLRGATFTITNLGGLGGTSFSPIVNWPELAILGIARTQKRVVETKDGFETRMMLPLCLSYDHRMIDGADAVRFTRKIAEMIEDPALLLLEG